VTVPPVWEAVLSILATYALTGVIDHDRPLVSVFQLARWELRAPRTPKKHRRHKATSAAVRVRERHVP
jgi:hypothetical protein